MSDTDVPGLAWLPSELDKSAEAMIKELENEFAPTDPIEDEVAAAPTEPAPEAPPPERVLEAPKSPEVGEVGLERIVAREVALRERERALESRESKLAELEGRLKQLETRQLPEDFESELMADPVGVLERFGVDPDQVVRGTLARRLGDKAPKELAQDIKAAQKDLLIQRELKALRAQIEAAERERAGRAYYDKVVSEIREYVTKPEGISAYAPTVAKVAQANSERVFSEILEVISTDAREKAAQNPGAPLLTYEEAAKRVESRWAALASVLGSVSQPANTSSSTKPASEVRPPVTKQPTSSVKPPDRPLAPWLVARDELEDAGLKEALAEFRRLEKPGSPS
jgi:hypothetical protein